MKNAKYFLLVIVIIATGAVLFFINKYAPINNPEDSKKTFPSQLINNSNNMKITSTAFENNANIPTKYTCDDMGINPPLIISDVPQDTLSLALIIDDPDAPIPGGFVHWVIFNLDPQTKEIKENSKPESGIEGTGSSGKQGYVSPCPPSGVHHYQFKLYALDEKLNFDSSATRNDIEKAIAGHIIEETLLVGLYQRQ